MNTIIGQEQTVGNIDKIFNIFKQSKANIRPHFILTGPSGSGKSFIIKTVASQYNLPYFEINAAQLTKEGTSGNSLSKVLAPLKTIGSSPNVCFVDELCKLFISGNTNDDLAHEVTNGVQNEFLKVLESDKTSVFGDYGKYENVTAKNTLFIFAGAFNGEENITLDRLRELNVKTEFLGRVGLIYNIESLKLEDLYKIVDNSALLDEYIKLYKDSDKEIVSLKIKQYLKDNYENNTIGARLINSLINQYFISGGTLDNMSAKRLSFQKKLQPLCINQSEDLLPDDFVPDL